MMNNYIEIEMLPAAHGRGGSFHINASFTLDNFPAPFCDIGIKIDTGCSMELKPEDLNTKSLLRI